MLYRTWRTLISGSDPMTNIRTSHRDSTKGANLQRLLRQSRALQQHRRERIRSVVVALLFISDVLAFSFSQVAAAYLKFQSGWLTWFVPASERDLGTYLPHFLFGLIFYLSLCATQELYRERRFLNLSGLFPKLVKIAILWCFIYLFISLFFRISPSISRYYVLFTGILSVPFVYAARYFILKCMLRRKWIEDLQQKVILIGWNREIESFIRLVARDPRHPYHILGWLRTSAAQAEDSNLSVKCLGHYDDVEQVIIVQRPDIVILEDVGVGVKAIDWLLDMCGREHVDFKIAGSFYRVFVSALRIQMIGGIPVLGIQRLAVKAWYNRILKRIVDIVGGIFGLIVFSPVMLYFAWRVRKESPGSVIYRQVRSGLRGEEFKILKIRSMKLDAEEDGIGWTTQDDPRRLKVGEFMRKWNIDELPQFWNVFKGEMSLVGPRPERPELIEDFKHDIRLYNMRHAVKPGMTGWAQIHGLRGDTSLRDRIRHDLYYIENWSVLMDFYIMAKTMAGNENAA